LSLPLQQYCNEVVLSRDIDRLGFVSFGAALSLSPFFACLFLKSLTLFSENIASILGLLLDHPHESSLSVVANVSSIWIAIGRFLFRVSTGLLLDHPHESSLSTAANVSSSGLPLVD
jgi:hypothetical protein